MIDYDTFMDWLLALGLSTRTVGIYVATLHRAEALAATLDLDLAALNPREARQLSEGWPPGRSSRSHLRSTLGHLWEAQGRLDGPVRALKVPRKPQGRCRALGEADAAILAAAARARGDKRGLATLLVLYGALRREEIARCAWTDLERRQTTGGIEAWLTVHGKGDKDRQIPVHPILLEAWCALEGRQHRASNWVFPGRWVDHVVPATIWGWIRTVARSCGIEVSPHPLRHTALATAHDNTGDLRATQEFAGHARPETTALYTRTTVSRLRAVVFSIDYSPRKESA